MRKEIYVLEDALCVVYTRRHSLGTGKWFLVRWRWSWRWTIMSFDNARSSISVCRTLSYGVAFRPADTVHGSVWFIASSVLSCSWSRECFSREMGYPNRDSHIRFEVAEAQQMGTLNPHSALKLRSCIDWNGPVTVAQRSKSRSEAGIVGSNPTQGIDVWYVYVFILCLCSPVFR
jgi:hypothetical protein